MNAQNTNQLLRFVQVTGAFAKRAMDELKTYKQATKTAAATSTRLADFMVSSAVIAPTEKAAAADMLNSHAGTLSLLQNAVEKIAELKQIKTKTAGELGGPGDLEQDEVFDAIRSPFVGARSNVKKASDMALIKGLKLG